MKSTIETLSPTRVRLDIEVAYSEMTTHVADAYKKVATQVNIPGFRKGKVPASMIDQRVGRGTVIDEAINTALPLFYGQAAREHSVAVIGRPEVDVKEFVDNGKLVFTVEVDVRPEVVLPDFSKITVEVANCTAVPARKGISAPPFFCNKYPAVVPRSAKTQQIMPNVEKPVERSPSNNFGESKNKTPSKPRTKPNTCRYESFSPSNGMAIAETKIGCKETITAVIPAGISINIA